MLLTTGYQIAMETEFLEKVKLAAEPLQYHKVYGLLTGYDNLSLFMESHVFAVFDFMSLVKSLQLELTGMQIPWRPVGSANTRYLINEIVTGEESDIDEAGQRTSHFELYLKAMRQVGANTKPIENLLALTNSGSSVELALELCGGPTGAIAFSQHTFNIIKTQPVGVRAAVFAFGREDLIPSMFLSMLAKMEGAKAAKLSAFRYYLERHIEVDGGQHSHLAWEMTRELLGQDKHLWKQAENAVLASLKARIALWDSVCHEIAGRTV